MFLFLLFSAVTESAWPLCYINRTLQHKNIVIRKCHAWNANKLRHIQDTHCFPMEMHACGKGKQKRETPNNVSTLFPITKVSPEAAACETHNKEMLHALSETREPLRTNSNVCSPRS